LNGGWGGIVEKPEQCRWRGLSHFTMTSDDLSDNVNNGGGGDMSNNSSQEDDEMSFAEEEEVSHSLRKTVDILFIYL
jgi:hypothetical protein